MCIHNSSLGIQLFAFESRENQVELLVIVVGSGV